MLILRTNENGTFFDPVVHCYILTGKISKIVSLFKDVNPCELRDSVGTTLLHLAAQYGNGEFAKYLIDSGAVVDAQDQQKQTPLMLAVDRDQMQTVRVLLEANADVFLADIDGQCALQKFLKRRGPVVNQFILTEFLRGVKVESLENSEFVATDEFHRACPLYQFMLLNNAEVTRILLEKGSPVDAKNPITGETALFVAVKLLNLKSIELLLKCNADVKVEGPMGKTPLAFISPTDDEESKALEAMKMLIAAGGILIDHDSRVNVLCELLINGSKEIVRTLLQSEIDLTFEDRKGLTSLHYLAKNRCVNILEELLELDINVNVRCRYGRTMLHYAAEVKNPSSVKFLLDHGVDVTARDNRQQTSFYYAAHPLYFDRGSRTPAAYLKDCVNCVEILLERDADLHDVFADERSLEFLSFNNRMPDTFLKIFTPVVAKLALNEVSSGRLSDTSMRKFIKSFSPLKATFDSIKRQLEEMKQIKIDDSTTVFEFLISNDVKILRLMRNKHFVSNLTVLMKEFNDSIPYYLQRQYAKIIHLVALRARLLPVINDVLLKYCNRSVENIAEHIFDYLQKNTWNEILDK